jgi:hypothetical protein
MPAKSIKRHPTTPPDCPVLEPARKAMRSGQDFNRALRRLRKSMLACEKCIQTDDCCFRRNFNSMVDAVIVEINAEWSSGVRFE